MDKRNLYDLTKGRCRGCKICDGILCGGELPGWGGIDGGSRFASNVRSWNEIEVEPASGFPEIAYAPVTGAVQNIGTDEEEPFYFTAAESAKTAGIGFCIGDGFPDVKLDSGIAAAARCGLTMCLSNLIRIACGWKGRSVRHRLPGLSESISIPGRLPLWRVRRKWNAKPPPS